jgi:hypothetical protein
MYFIDHCQIFLLLRTLQNAGGHPAFIAQAEGITVRQDRAPFLGPAIDALFDLKEDWRGIADSLPGFVITDAQLAAEFHTIDLLPITAIIRRVVILAGYGIAAISIPVLIWNKVCA